MTPKKPKVDTEKVITELSELAYFKSPQVDKPTSGQVDKPVRPLVEKYTTHLYHSTIKTIKKYAFEHDMKDYEVVQRALVEFFEHHKDEKQ